MRTAVSIACMALAAGLASADSYRVSQCDPSTQEFEVLGVIEGVPTALSAADYYGFTSGDPDPDLPPGSPELVSDRSHLWIVESEIDGVCLLFIHDGENDGSGGHAETEWKVVGDPDGLGWLVQDGPPDDYDTEIGDATSIFSASHTWPAENVDGGMVGGFNGCWMLDGQFTDFGDGPGNEIEGLDEWVAYSNDLSELPLALEADRPIRIEPLAAADCNEDGSLDILDFVCFQGLFAAGDPDADCNEDGMLNVLDFICFQAAFQDGCG